MKKILTALSFVIVIQTIVLGHVYAQSSYSYQVKKIIDDVYLLEPLISEDRWVTSNITVIINEKDVLVVDSGLLPAAATEAIKEIKKLTGKPVKYLVNTHWHGDHWQGNETFVAAYPGLEVIASEEGYKGIMKNGMLWVRQLYVRNLQNILTGYENDLAKGTTEDDKVLSEERKQQLKEVIPQFRHDLEGIKTLKPVAPNLTFSQNMVLKRGGREIQLHYLGWGNTSGDAVVYLPKEKVLITGDLVVYPSPFESGSFSGEWFETSKKLKNFEFSYLIPGHGGVQTDATYLDYLNALFEEIIRQTYNAFLSGKTTIDDVKLIVTHQSVVDALSKDPRFSGYLKNLDPGFIPAAVRTGFQKAREGKL